MIIDIPLNGGLRTFADSEQIGNDGCTVLKNIDIHIPGKFQTRTIFGDKATISDNVKAITRWVAPDGTAYWVIRTDSTLHLTTDPASLGTDYSGSSTGLEIANYGDYLRFFGDLTKRPQTLHYYPSTRKHFWGMLDPADGFYISEGTPDLDSRFNFFVTSDLKSSSTASYPFGNLDLENKVYYYKVAPVFDGVQEGLLSEILMDTSDISSTNNSTGVVSGILRFIDTDSTFDNRLSGINFYRATESGGPYYKILSASCLGDKDPALTKVTDGIVGKGIYIEDSTATVTSKKYIIHGGGTSELGSIGVSDTEYTGTTATDKNFSNFTTGISSYLNCFNAQNVNDPPTNTWISQEGGAFSALASDTSNEIITTSQMFDVVEFKDDWDIESSASLITRSSTYRKYGSYSAVLSADTGTTSGESTYVGYDLPTLTDGQDYVICFWIKTNDKFQNNADGTNGHGIRIELQNQGSSLDNNIHSQILTSSGGYAYASWFTERDLFTNNTLNTSGFQDYQLDWTFVMHKFTADSTDIRFRVKWYETVGNGSNELKIYLDGFGLYKVGNFVDTGSMSFGRDTLISPSLTLDRTDGKKGNISYLYETPGTYTDRVYSRVKANTDKAIQFTGDLGFTDESVEMHLCRNYLWLLNSLNNYSIVFIDHALNDGISPALEAVSDISVNYKYSQFLDGRNYVANVKFPNADESHNNWIIFSELNQPDILPVSNYIEIQDSQGGEIVGLGRMLGDLVVFMERGIYRLHTPSTNPGSWSLIESEENIGCVAPDSIIEVEGILYFGGKDHIYGLDANFQAQPITKNIQDVWQGTLSQENTKITYDPKLKRLICQFGGSTTVVYLFHLDSGEWTQWEYGNGITVNHILVDEDLNINLVHDGGTSLIYDDNVSTTYDSANSEIGTPITRETGWIKLSDSQNNAIIRKLNLKYSATITNGIAQSIAFTLYADGDTSSVWTKTITESSSVTNKIQSLRVSRRAKNFKLKIEATSLANTASTDQNIATIERLGVEVD